MFISNEIICHMPQILIIFANSRALQNSITEIDSRSAYWLKYQR